MDAIRYLLLQEVLLIHQDGLKRFGGTGGIRDEPAIRAALGRPKLTFDGVEVFPTKYRKAAAYLDSFARNHPFIDGNKRVAFLSANQFLKKNGMMIMATQVEAYDFVMDVVLSGPEIEGIADWIERHCIPAGS